MDLKIAWRNIWRNPRRTLLTLAAIAFGTLLLIFMLSWQFGSYNTMINSAVGIHTGHLQIQHPDYKEKRTMYAVVDNPTEIASKLEAMPAVAAHTFRANAFSLVSSEKRTYGAMVIGIDPRGEAAVSTLESLVRKGSFLKSNQGNQALVGELLARNLKVDIGDELVVLGQGRDGSVAATVVRVEGIFASGQDELDRHTMHVPLPFFQETFAMQNGVHEVVILGRSLEDIPQIKTELAAHIQANADPKPLAVWDWSELMPGLVQAIKVDLVSGFIFYIILIIVVAFSILNTFLMAVFERTREFGILLAMGTTPGRLSKMLLLESFAMTLLGVTIGIAAGALVTWYFEIHGVVISGAGDIMRQYGLPERMHPELSFKSVAIGAAIVWVLTLITALYPALKVRKLTPLEAMSAV
jgi:putative ABC transport system permease protein